MSWFGESGTFLISELHCNWPLLSTYLPGNSWRSSSYLGAWRKLVWVLFFLITRDIKMCVCVCVPYGYSQNKNSCGDIGEKFSKWSYGFLLLSICGISAIIPLSRSNPCLINILKKSILFHFSTPFVPCLHHNISSFKYSRLSVYQILTSHSLA